MSPSALLTVRLPEARVLVAVTVWVPAVAMTAGLRLLKLTGPQAKPLGAAGRVSLSEQVAPAGMLGMSTEVLVG